MTQASPGARNTFGFCCCTKPAVPRDDEEGINTNQGQGDDPVIPHLLTRHQYRGGNGAVDKGTYHGLRECSVDRRECSLDKIWAILSGGGKTETKQLMPPPGPAGKKIPAELIKNAGRCPSTPPKFAGRWMADRYEGDMNGFLTDIGTGYVLRKLAESVNYGVGKQIQDIKLDGVIFRVVNEGGLRVTTMEVTINGGLTETIGIDGNEVLVAITWESDTVMFMQGKHPSGEAIPTTRRWMDGDEMVMEVTAPSGLKVTRYFKRHPG